MSDLAETGQSLSTASFDTAAARAGALRPVSPVDVTPAVLRWNRRRRRAEEKLVRRSRWWYPLLLILLVVCGLYSMLRADQRLAALLIWPRQGAQFQEIGDSRFENQYRPTLVIVAGGLNRKSGSLVAEALLPSLGGPSVRVFSLVYGSGIYDQDIATKFDQLFAQYQPERVRLFGSSMGGDVVLRLAAHFFANYADVEVGEETPQTPVLDAIYLDCAPLSTADVRYAARARADFLTGLTEQVGTDGGAATRLVAEMLAQRRQWSFGNFPFVTIKPYDFGYKWREVWREKLNPMGVSTTLVRDQYSVIRRFNAELILAGFAPGTDVVYLRPDVPESDTTIDVQQVTDRLRVLGTAFELDVTVLQVRGGSHASAARDAALYNPLITTHRVRATVERAALPIR